MSLQIIVQPADWGDASLTDIQVLLTDVATHIHRYLREPVSGLIIVKPTPNEDHVPRTLFRSSADQPFLVQLAARDRRWSKFSYQFSHEFCHVLSAHDRLRNCLNGWFHEAICELASLFTLRHMAKSWVLTPPFPNWSDYAGSLSGYAENCLSKPECQLATGIGLSDWLVAEEEILRGDRYQRDKNAIVAYSLLPLFEKDPSGWNTIRAMPNSASSFAQYLAEWYSNVDLADQAFLKGIISKFNVDVDW